MNKESTWNGSLIEFKDGKVLLIEEGLNKVLLRDEVRDTPVAVICIAGAYNRGKSSMMNFLLQHLRDGGLNWDATTEGFKSSSRNVRRTTTGLDVWPELLMIGNMPVILMDSQGLMDNITTQYENAIIVTFAALTSSLFIYNISQRFESQDFHNLQYFLSHAPMTVSRTNNTECVAQELLLLVRDWKFTEDFPFGISGGQKYFEHFLDSENAERAVEAESIRSTLSQFFERTECCLLPHPGDVFLSAGPPSLEFQNECSSLTSHILSILQPKRIQNTSSFSTGQQLADQIRGLVVAINNGGMPRPQTLAQLFGNHAAKVIIEAILKEYDNFMAHSDEWTQDQLRDRHNEAFLKSMQMFESKTLYGSRVHSYDLRDELEKRLQRLEERRELQHNLQELREIALRASQANQERSEEMNSLMMQLSNQEEIAARRNADIERLQEELAATSQMRQQNDQRADEMRNQMESLMERIQHQEEQNKQLQNTAMTETAKLQELRQRVEQEQQTGFLEGLVNDMFRAVNAILQGVQEIAPVIGDTLVRLGPAIAAGVNVVMAIAKKP